MEEMMGGMAMQARAVAPGKKFVGLLDEYSRRLNPWRLVSTYGVADASDLSEVRDLFRKFGIVVVRRAYNPQETADFYQIGKKFTGLEDLDVVHVARRTKKHYVGGSPAVVEPKFWPFVAHPTIKAIAREVYGAQPVVEFGTSMAAHYSARGLHRDFPTWFQDPSTSYNLVNGINTVLRILTYPTRAGMPAGTFGFIPFSHRKDLFDKQAARCGIKRPFEWYDNHRQLTRLALDTGVGDEVEEMDSHIVWVHLDAGDILLLDARMQHGGDFIVGPRYLFVMSLGAEDTKSKTLLNTRWATQMQPHELAYYEFLNERGLCSAQLLEDCRKAAARRKPAAAVAAVKPASPALAVSAPVPPEPPAIVTAKKPAKSAAARKK